MQNGRAEVFSFLSVLLHFSVAVSCHMSSLHVVLPLGKWNEKERGNPFRVSAFCVCVFFYLDGQIAIQSLVFSGHIVQVSSARRQLSGN